MKKITFIVSLLIFLVVINGCAKTSIPVEPQEKVLPKEIPATSPIKLDLSISPINEEKFAEVIDTTDYIVHLTPKGNSNGLYVTVQTPLSFTVKENNAGTSNIEFNYLISGKRKDYKDIRLYKMNNFDFGNQTG